MLRNFRVGDEFLEEGHVFGDAFAHRVRSAGDRRIAECNNAIFDVVLRHHCQGRLGETLEKLRRRPCRRPAAAFGGRDLDVSWPDLERRFIVARPFRRDCSGSRGSTGSGLRHLPNSRAGVFGGMRRRMFSSCV